MVVEILPNIRILKVRSRLHLHAFCLPVQYIVHICRDSGMLGQGRLSSRASSQLLQEEGLADSDLIPGKYEGNAVRPVRTRLQCQ